MKSILVAQAWGFLSRWLRCAGLVMLGLCMTAHSAIAKVAQPNLIVILTDDLGYGDLGCYGAKTIQTPHLDTMAKQGMRYTDFYVPAAQCSPTRAAFLTGSYPQRINSHRLFGKDSKGLNPDEITIAELLQKQGYKTACIGKWHLGKGAYFHPNRHGFDHFYGFQNPSYSDKTARVMQLNQQVVAVGPESSEITDDLTEASLKFLRQHKQGPFFLYLAHDMPHIPLEIPAKRRSVSKGGIYGDVIEHLDLSVGKIIDELKRLEIAENTLVIFTSDNGPALHWSIESGSAGPLRGSKHTTCEGGFRVPCIAWWQGKIPAGKTCSALVSIMDFLPTFTKLAGGEVPQDRVIDGKDVWSLLSGEKGATSPHEAFFYYKRVSNGRLGGGRIEGVRVGQWKLRVPLESFHKAAIEHRRQKESFDLERVALTSDGHLPKLEWRYEVAKRNLKLVQHAAATEKICLYDLSKDLAERDNLAAKYPEKVRELHALMKAFDKSLREKSRPCGDSKKK